MRSCYWLFVGVLFFCTSNTIVHAQEKETPKLALPPGAETVTESKVAATVSFLASDELAGRGTGSPEFDIAAMYVASRFRSAGLQGAGDDGTFFHVTKQTLKQIPSRVVLKNTNGEAIQFLGILGAGDGELNYRGALQSVDLAKATELMDLPGFVIGEFEPTGKGARALAQLSRLAQSLETAGAKGLILRTEPSSEWVAISNDLQGKPRMESRLPIRIPILLVDRQSPAPEQIEVEVPATKTVEQSMRNVIAVIPGSDPELAKQAVLFSAHLDHLGRGSPTGTDAGTQDLIYNGADDDASGVTAVLSLADAFAAMKTPPKRSLLFMAFWGEESGLLGSKAFVDRPSWPLESIVANVNIEMIGRPEDGARGKIWVTGWNESNLGAQMRESASRWGVEIFEHPKFSAMLYRSSDNWSFAQKGVIAHSFSAGSLHQDYHQVDDEWDRLEIPHMTRVIQGLFVGSLPLADGSVTPKSTKE
jgi:hypothetical protein